MKESLVGKQNRRKNQYKIIPNQTHSEKLDNKHDSVASKESDQTSFAPNFYNPFEIKRRRRTSREQARLLRKAYMNNSKPNGRERDKLAKILEMPPRAVQVWFQNKRAKEKQQKESKVEDANEENSLSATPMVHSFSQSSTPSSHSDQVTNSMISTESDHVPHAHSLQNYTMTHIQPQLWRNSAEISAFNSELYATNTSPVLSQVQPLPWYSSHQINDQAHLFKESYYPGTRFNNYEPQILVQMCPSRDINPYVYIDNALSYHRNVDDWVNTISLFHRPTHLSANIMSRNCNPTLLLSTTQQEKAYWLNQQVKR